MRLNNKELRHQVIKIAVTCCCLEGGSRKLNIKRTEVTQLAGLDYPVGF